MVIKIKTYFIISDIHSYAAPLEEALGIAGFNLTNPDHILIVNGDAFDRGDETLKVFNFLTSLPKERCILIRGNHEYLFLKAVDSRMPKYHDFTNGTVKSILAVAGYSAEEYEKFYFSYLFDYYYSNINPVTLSNVMDFWKAVTKKVKESEFYSWISDDRRWKTYVEVNNYIITHSFIPLAFSENASPDPWSRGPIYNADSYELEYLPDWRTLGQYTHVWEEASWCNPIKLYKAGLFEKEAENNKVLVCGHWAASDFHKEFEGKENDNSIYFGKNIIALDTTTALSNDINVLIIKDNECYDKYGKLLEVN